MSSAKRRKPELGRLSLERFLGPRLQHPAVLTLLQRFGSPAQIRKAGRRRLITLLRPKTPRMAERLVEEIFAALDKHHTQALLCLARRRADVLFAMLRDGTFHEPRTTGTK